MTISDSVVDAGAPKRGFGKISLTLALAAFCAGGGSLALFGLTPKEAGEPMQTIVTIVFMSVFLVAAPTAHVVGLVMGLIAIFKHGESTVQGILGVILNGLSVGAGILLMWALLVAAASFT